MPKIEYLGNPEFKSEKDKIEWLSKILYCEPSQIGSIEMPIDKIKKIFKLEDKDA
jgi:hypothetical protein